MAEGHPDRGRLLAHLDGELGGDEGRALRRHLEGCERCRRRRDELAERDATFASAARRLDRPVPEIANPAASAARDGGGGVVPVPGGLPVPRAAAAAVALLLAGALLTPPGRALAERALDGLAGLFRGGAPTAAVSGGPGSDTTRGDGDPDAADRVSGSAVSAAPRDGRLLVAVESGPGAAGRLRVGFAATQRGVVDGAIRDVERRPGELRVRVRELDGLRILLPDSVASGEVRVNGRTVLRQRGREAIPAVAADTAGADLLLRVGR